MARGGLGAGAAAAKVAEQKRCKPRNEEALDVAGKKKVKQDSAAIEPDTASAGAMKKKAQMRAEEVVDAAAEENVEEEAALHVKPAKLAKKKSSKKQEKASELELETPVVAEDERPCAKSKKIKNNQQVEDAAGTGVQSTSVEEGTLSTKRQNAQPNEEGKPPKKAKRKEDREEDEGKVCAPAGASGGKTPSSGDTSGQAAAGLEPRTVFVGGIPWSCGEDILRRDFSECGEVVDINLLTDRVTGKSRGVAFVTFADEAGVEAALKYDGDDYGGRILKVYQAEAHALRAAKEGGRAASLRRLEVFVKGLPADTSEESLRKRFSECGSIDKVNLPTRGSGRCKGFAWLTFKSKDGLDKAIDLNGADCAGSKIVVEVSGQHKAADSGAAKSKGKGRGKAAVSIEREVFLSNLPYEVTEADLMEDFGECGDIERMHMPTRADSKSMGFAWITFKTKEGLEKALVYNGDDYGGRRLKVEKSGMHRAVQGKDAGAVKTQT